MLKKAVSEDLSWLENVMGLEQEGFVMSHRSYRTPKEMD